MNSALKEYLSKIETLIKENKIQKRMSLKKLTELLVEEFNEYNIFGYYEDGKDVKGIIVNNLKNKPKIMFRYQKLPDRSIYIDVFYYRPNAKKDKLQQVTEVFFHIKD